MAYKNIAVLLTFLIFASLSTFAAAVTSTNTSSSLEWEQLKEWQLPERPLDVVHSLDGKYVFVLTSNKNVLIYSSQGQLEGSVPVDAGVNAIDIAPRAEMIYLVNSEKSTFTALSIDFIKDINISGSPFRGPENAPVTMVLFTDFECPYCKKFEPLVVRILKDNPKTVKLVMKNMPLQFHKAADPAARAALAAGEQGKFWEFHDELWAVEKLNDKTINDIAVKLDLDLAKWKNDMNSPVIRQKINVDLQDAQKAGVTGTPTLFINGRLLKNRSIQGFQQMINEELNKK